MKANAIARIVLYSILALLLIGILLVGIAADDLMFQLGDPNGTVVENEGYVDAANVKAFEIDWAAGSINIVIADTDKITFQETAPENSKYKMTYEVSGNTLKLSYGQPTISFGIGSIPNKDLVITVPRDWVCEELEIDGASLDINLQDLTIGKIDLDGASCNLNFTGSLEKMEADGAAQKITLVCGNRISSIDIDGASCDLNLTLPKDCGFLLEMDGLSCDLYTELPGTSTNGQTVYGDGHCKINVDGVSCDVTITESTECSHVWDDGVEVDVPGGGHMEVKYTCTVCGETKHKVVTD